MHFPNVIDTVLALFGLAVVSVLLAAALFTWVMVVFRFIVDIHRQPNMTQKAALGWQLAVIGLPIVGVLSYARSPHRSPRPREAAPARRPLARQHSLG